VLELFGSLKAVGTVVQPGLDEEHIILGVARLLLLLLPVTVATAIVDGACGSGAN
jgi:hypothetical protein